MTTERTSSDLLTVLRCRRPLHACKRHERTAHGKWVTRGYSTMRNYSAELVRLHTAEDAWRLLRGLESDSRAFICRDLPAEGQNLDRMLRRKDTMCHQPEGLRLVGVDIDDIELPFEVDPHDRESLECAIKWLIYEVMPKGVRESTCYYQWSNSAGVKGWNVYRIHLWFWLDRKVCRFSLKEWATPLKSKGVDPCLYDACRVHYTAAPMFYDALGGRLPEVMGSDAKGSLRSGLVRGKSDTAVAPASWLSFGEWSKLEHKRRLDRIEQARINRKAIESLQKQKGGAKTLEGMAQERLDRIVDALRVLPAGNRHQYVVGKIRLAFGLRAILPIETIADAIEATAAESLVRQAGRSESVARAEVRRIITGCQDPAIAPALDFGLGTRDMRRRTYDLPKGKPAAPVDHWLTPESSRVIVEPPTGKPWPEPEGGWHSEDIKPLDLSGARASLDAVMLQAQRGGLFAIASPAGSGKSYAAKRRLLIEPTARGERQALMVMPTLKLCLEAVNDLNAMASDLGYRGWQAVLSTSRRDSIGDEPPTCFHYAEIREASRVHPDGARLFCKGCEFHPSKAGMKDTCPFFKGIRREASADVVVMTHARYALLSSASNEGSEQHIDWSSYRAASALWRKAKIELDQSDTIWTVRFIGGDGDGFDYVPELEQTRSGNLTASCQRKVKAWINDRIESARRVRKYSSVIIDEDPSGVLIHQADIDLDAAGAIVAEQPDPEEWGALLALLASGRDYSSDDLRRLLPDLQLEVNYDSGARAIAESMSLHPDERTESLSRHISWRTIEALKQTLEQDWGCASIHSGVLRVSYSQRLDTDCAESFVYLDATSTKQRARALLGDEVTFKRIEVAWPDQAKVHWIPCNAGARSRLIGADGLPAGRRVPLIWAAALLKYAQAGALAVTRKGLTSDKAWTSHVLKMIEAEGASVIWHKGPEGRGVNKYRDCHTVIIDPWHLPRHVLEAQAYHLSTLAGDSWHDEASRRLWRSEAAAQLLSAEILQELARIRHLSADEDSPKRIVIIDSRDPRSLGLPIDEVIDPDRLAYEVMGVATGVDTAPSILRATVEASGGLYAPTIDRRNVYKIDTSRPFQSDIVERQLNTSDVLLNRLGINDKSKACADIICNWTANHGSWQALSRRSGVSLLWVYTDKGGDPLPFFYTRRISRQDVESWLRTRSISRYRVSVMGHSSPWYDVTGVDSELTLKLMDAHQSRLLYLIASGAKVEAIAKCMGWSKSKLYALLKPLRAPSETCGQALQRLWHESSELAQQVTIATSSEAQARAMVELVRELYSKALEVGILSPAYAFDHTLYDLGLDDDIEDT